MMKYYYGLSPVLIGVSIVLVQSQVALGLSAPEIEKIATGITVRIVNSQNRSDSGSGIIIKRSGNTYTVLTAYHVVKSGQKYQIFTPDGQSNYIKSMQPVPQVDLAILEFNSSKNYSIAKIGNSQQATRTNTVYVVGFPAKTAIITNPDFLFFKNGQIYANGTAQRDGYNIIYDVATLKGTSGGAVLNEQGEVIAVHGRADEQQISENSDSKIITGLGTTIYSAAQQMLAVGVDLGLKLPSINVASAPKADDLYLKANQKSGQKDYQGAINDYTEAIRLNPNYAEAYLYRGINRAQLGDNSGAIADYNLALQINPKYATAYYQRGIVQLNDNREEIGAIKDFLQAADFYFEQGNKADGYRSQGLVRFILKDYQGAITVFTQSIKLNPNDWQAYNNRGLASAELGDKQGAMADYNAAIKINPNFANAYYNRGLTRTELGDKPGAIADYNATIKINPNFADAYIHRGIARAKLTDNTGAIADYTAAIKINPNFADAYYNRGIARAELTDNTGAIADYTAAIKINPNFANAYYNRAIARAELKDNTGAIADYTAAIKINPNFADAYYTRGIARGELRDKTGAIADFQKAAELYQQQSKKDDYQNALNQIRSNQPQSGAVQPEPRPLFKRPPLAPQGAPRAIKGAGSR